MVYTEKKDRRRSALRLMNPSRLTLTPTPKKPEGLAALKPGKRVAYEDALDRAVKRDTEMARTVRTRGFVRRPDLADDAEYRDTMALLGDRREALRGMSPTEKAYYKARAARDPNALSTGEIKGLRGNTSVYVPDGDTGRMKLNPDVLTDGAFDPSKWRRSNADRAAQRRTGMRDARSLGSATINGQTVTNLSDLFKLARETAGNNKKRREAFAAAKALGLTTGATAGLFKGFDTTNGQALSQEQIAALRTGMQARLGELRKAYEGFQKTAGNFTTFQAGEERKAQEAWKGVLRSSVTGSGPKDTPPAAGGAGGAGVGPTTDPKLQSAYHRSSRGAYDRAVERLGSTFYDMDRRNVERVTSQLKTLLTSSRMLGIDLSEQPSAAPEMPKADRTNPVV